MLATMTNQVRGLVNKARVARDLSWRKVPAFPVRPASGAEPTVYYFSPNPARPTGGIRVIYRHVDTLAANGINAAVILTPGASRPQWFPSTTRVLNPADVVLGPEDILVVPECYGPGLDGLPDGVPVVIFNQGAYHTFDRVPVDPARPGAPYRGDKDIRALLAVSQDSADLLSYAFPELPVAVSRQVIDAQVFHPGPGPKARRIAFTTSRRGEDRHQLLHILGSRGHLADWELAPIAGRTERETAEIMRSSAIFLSFSDREGFGLPPAEAMSSGCYVVGYTGLGGRDFFDPAYCSPVPESDLLAFAKAIDAACTAYDADPVAFAARGQLAHERITARYCEAALREDLLSFYAPLLAQKPKN